MTNIEKKIIETANIQTPSGYLIDNNCRCMIQTSTKKRMNKITKCHLISLCGSQVKIRYFMKYNTLQLSSVVKIFDIPSATVNLHRYLKYPFLKIEVKCEKKKKKIVAGPCKVEKTTYSLL